MQPANRDIAVGRIDLDAIAPASGLLSCDQCRAGADEGVQNYGLPMRTIPDSVSDHGHGLNGRMQAQIIPVAAKAVNASIAPDVRAISAVLAEFYIVDVGRGAQLKTNTSSCCDRYSEPMPPLFLAQTQRFFRSVYAAAPAANISCRWRQSMH